MRESLSKRFEKSDISVNISSQVEESVLEALLRSTLHSNPVGIERDSLHIRAQISNLSEAERLKVIKTTTEWIQSFAASVVFRVLGGP